MKGNVIPAGGLYTTSGGTTCGPGELPPIASVGDELKLGDYTYVYTLSGWNVDQVAKKNKDTYGEILSEINGEPVTGMRFTFYRCTSLTTAPAIPRSVKSLFSTFWGCTSLTSAPVIPSSVVDMNSTFFGCVSLAVVPDISGDIENMFGTFAGCTSLISAPAIRGNVTNISDIFHGCTSLVIAPEIPKSVTHMHGAFSGCTVLKNAPEIPGNVIRMGCVSYGCSASVYDGYLGESVSNTGDPYSSVIPDGGVYDACGTIYAAGSLFPAIRDGDTYTYGDYKFSYAYGRWKVEVLDTTKTSYMRIPSEINGGLVTSLSWTFDSVVVKHFCNTYG